ncbi:MAG TPA: response regulator [bacterium]|nr:response regulator [bacterium]HPN44730.1 response regulator [bacterium]
MILIVEDEPVFRSTITEMLQVLGMSIDIATDGYQALKNLEKKNYTLAIIDLVLPGPMNGLDVIKKIKLHTPSTRIIAISGYGNQSLIQKTYKAGADLFIPKPFKPEKLVDEAESLLAKKKSSDPVVQVEEEPKVDKGSMPELFNGFSRDTLVNLIKLGKVYNFEPDEKCKINYTRYITTVISGTADCIYMQKNIGVINSGESIGQESLVDQNDENAQVIFLARSPLKIFVVPKVEMLKYLHENKLLPIFDRNIKLSLNNNVLVKAGILSANNKDQEIAPNPPVEIKKSVQPPPAEVKKSMQPPPEEDPNFDFTTSDLLGI